MSQSKFKLARFFPIVKDLKGYNRSMLIDDLSAGLIVGVMLIPQGMAYAMLAGLPPIYGLYAATLPLIIYALLGTSRHLAVGPVAMISLLVASGVGSIAVAGTEEYIGLVIVLAFMAGLIQFSLGLFKLGFLVNFLSHPVIAGFTSAAAIIIIVSQFNHLLGIKIPQGKLYDNILFIFQNIKQTNVITIIIGVLSMVMLQAMKLWNNKIPAPLVVVILAVSVVYLFQLTDRGVSIVGEIPTGLMRPAIPALDLGAIRSLALIALTISFVSFMESIAVAKAIQAKHKSYDIDPNKELIALGLANIVGSFFKSMPVTGGFSRTAVNDQSGAKTSVASIISAFLIILTLLYLTKYFYYLPNAVLAAIIIMAVYKLIDIKEARHLWQYDKTDFTVFVITAASTLLIGIEEGILIGVVISLAYMIYKQSYPHVAPLGRVPESTEFRNLNRFENLITDDKIFIFRYDAPLYFANCNYFKDIVSQRLHSDAQIKHIIVECTAITNIDSSAIHMLKDLIEELMAIKVKLYFSNVKGPVRDILHRNGLHRNGDKLAFFLMTKDAVDYIKHQQEGQFDQYINQFQ